MRWLLTVLVMIIKTAIVVMMFMAVQVTGTVTPPTAESVEKIN